MRKNSKGDILAPIGFQIQITATLENGDAKVSLSKITAISVGYDSRDGERFTPVKSVEDMDIAKCIEKGIVTLEQYQTVQKFFADCYDGIDAIKEPKVEPIQI